MELSEKLQELRKEKGLTQEELAEALFVSRTAISKWESGRGVPNIESLKAISKFFSVSIDELLKRYFRRKKSLPCMKTMTLRKVRGLFGMTSAALLIRYLLSLQSSVSTNRYRKRLPIC